LGGRGGRNIIFKLDAILGLVVATHRSFYLWEGAPVPIVQEAGWTAELLWTCLEKRKSLASYGVPTPIFRARSHFTGYAGPTPAINKE